MQPWLARFLARRGVEVHLMRSSSLPVDRKARRAKTDVIDVGMLLHTLLAVFRGEPRVCSEGYRACHRCHPCPSRDPKTKSIGLWRGSEETALYIADFIPSAQDAVYAIRAHWGVVGYTMLAMRRLRRRKPQPNQSRDLRETTVVRRQHPPLQRRQNVLSHRDQRHRRLEIINLHVKSVE
jgi:hypothetical protein